MQEDQFMRQEPAEKNELVDNDQLSFRIGDQCIWITNDIKERGIVKFIGYLKGRKMLHAGVEFENKIGKGTGVFNREQLFFAKNDHAAFVQLSDLQSVKMLDQFEQSLLDNMCSLSEKNDAILLIENQQLHVNRSFLSYHSDYIRALFSSNFKEGQLQEIPIKDITVDEFKLVLSIIHPETVFPINDKTVEKLLELADRFLIPAVMKLAETHLCTYSKIENDMSLWMADKYRMMKLLDLCILRVDTVEKAKKLQFSPHFNEISDGTNAKLFKRLPKIV